MQLTCWLVVKTDMEIVGCVYVCVRVRVCNVNVMPVSKGWEQ